MLPRKKGGSLHPRNSLNRQSCKRLEIAADRRARVTVAMQCDRREACFCCVGDISIEEEYDLEELQQNEASERSVSDQNSKARATLFVCTLITCAFNN